MTTIVHHASENGAEGSSSPAPRSRRSELRSRRGCLTCKQRRKKCDEDFQTRSNGAVACTRCSDRKLECLLPGNSGSGGAGTSGSSSSTVHSDPMATAPIQPASLPSDPSSSSSGGLQGRGTALGEQRQRSALSSQPQQQPATSHMQQRHQQQQQPQQQQHHHHHQPQHQQHPSLHHAAWNLGALGGGAAAYSAHFPFLSNQPQLFAQTPNSAGLGHMHRPSSRFNPAAAVSPWSSNYTLPEGMMQAPGSNVMAQQATSLQHADYAAMANAAAAAAGVNPSSMPAQFIPNASAELDNMMLDDFVQELMSLAEPGTGVDGSFFGTSTTSSPAVDASASRKPSSTTHSGAQDHQQAADGTSGDADAGREAPTTTSQQGTSHSDLRVDGNGRAIHSTAPTISKFTSLEEGKASSRYQKFLASDAMEKLLKKYSPIYERFWYSTLMLSESDKRKAIINHLMGVVHSHKVCQASTVAVCLAYHDLVQRMRESDTTKAVGDASSSHSTADGNPPDGMLPVSTFSNLATQTFGDRNSGDSKAYPKTPSLSAHLMGMFPEANRKRKRARSSGSRTLDDSHDNGAQGRHGPETDESGAEDSETDESAESFRGSDVGSERAAGGEHDEDAPTFAAANQRHADGETGSTEPRLGQGRHSLISAGAAATASVGTAKGSTSRTRPSSALAAIRSAEVWFEIALDAMNRELSDLSIEQQLCVTINLRWALVCFGGAKKARLFMDEIGKVIDRSGYDLATLVSGEKVGTLASTMLQTAVISDILDSACVRGTRARTKFSRTLGNLARHPPPKQHLPPPPFFSKISPVTYELLGCTMAVSDLGADMVEGKVTKPAEVARRSKEIEDKIARCAPWCDPNVSGKMRIKLFALQEIWRQTTLIQLYQIVHRHGPFSKKLQSALEEIISLASILAPSSTFGTSRPGSEGLGGLSSGYSDAHIKEQQDFWMEMASWEMCMVWFLASTVAVTAEQRKFCLQKLEGLGMEQANLDNIDVIKRLWKLADETGHTVDWRDFVEESGLAVTFIF